MLAILLFGLSSATAAQLTLTWSDNSNNETGFKIERSPNGTSFSQIATVGANTSSYTNTGLADGTRYYYRVRAWNAAGNSGYTNVSNAVTAAAPPPATNTPPMIASIANQTVAENGVVGPIAFTVGDQETTVANLTLTRVSSNTGLIPLSGIVFGGGGSSRTVTITPAPSKSGTATITVRVSDGQATASRSFAVTVVAAPPPPPPPAGNTAPTITSIPGRTIDENTGTGPIGFKVTDAESKNADLTLSRISSNTTLIPLSGILFGGSSTDRTVSVTPASNRSGVAQVTVTVSDGELTASRSFQVNVLAIEEVEPPQPGNTPPSITSIASQVIAESSRTAVIPFKVTDTESVNANLTLSANSSNATLVPTGAIVFGGASTNRTVMVSPVAGRSGTAVITVVVSDGALTASTAFRVTVQSVNDAPTISPIADQTIEEGRSTGSIAFTVTDGDDPDSSLTLTGSSNDTQLVPFSAIVFGGSGSNRTVTVTPVSSRTGTAIITVTVSDGSASSSRVFRVAVDPSDQPVTPGNTAPSITSIADQVILEDSATAPIAFKVTDAESKNRSLVLTAVSSNRALMPDQNLTFSGSSTDRTVTAVPLPGKSGDTQVTVTVSDGQMTDIESFRVSVIPTNDAPTISGIPNLTVNQGVAPGPIGFNIDDDETDPSSLVLSVGSSNRTLVPLSGIEVAGTGKSRTVTVTPDPAQSGETVISVRVDDGQKTATETFRLTINPLNRLSVSLTSPAAGQPFASGTNIPMAVLISAPSRVARVEFYVNGVKLGQDTSSPFSFVWSNAPTGSHQLYVRAVETSGAFQDSPTIGITVAKVVSLSVDLISPSEDESMELGELMALEAEVVGPKTAVKRVDFFVGNTRIKQEFYRPYTATWKPQAEGVYSLRARVISDTNKASDSTARSVTVKPPGVTVDFVSPRNESSLTFGESFAIEAVVSDISRTARVEFFDGSKRFHTEYYSPYQFSWKPGEPGTHRLSARVYDASGSSNQSGYVDVTVTSPAGVTVILRDPQDGAVIAVDQLVTLRASIDNSGPEIDRVEFFSGAAKLGSDASAPYALNWRAGAVGSRSLTAQAITASGGRVVSESVAVSVIDAPLVIDLKTPIDGQVVTQGGPMILSATSNDPGRTVRIEFQVDGSKVGERTSEPFSHEWTPTEPGSYVVSAKGQAQDGRFFESDWAVVTVAGASDVRVTMTDPEDGGFVEMGQAVTVSAEVSSSLDPIERVDFWAGSEKIGTEWFAPYLFTWTPKQTGMITLRARAQTRSGTRFTSNRVSVNARYSAIDVRITSPTSGGILHGQSILVEATASSTAPVARMEFMVDGEVVSDDFDSPYLFRWRGSTPGLHELGARAFDPDDTPYQSETVAVQVGPPPLTVSLLNPANAIRINPGDDVVIEAATSDPGRTSRLEFMVDGDLVGTLTAEPYQFTWKAIEEGTYGIQVRAIDLEGNGALSKEAIIKVNAPLALNSGVYRGVFSDGVDASVSGRFALHVSEEGVVVFLGYDEQSGTGFVSTDLNPASDGSFEILGQGPSGDAVLVGTVDPDGIQGQIGGLGRVVSGSRLLLLGEPSYYQLVGVRSQDTQVHLIVDSSGGAFVGVSDGGRFVGAEEDRISTDSGFYLQSQSLGIELQIDQEEGTASGFLNQGSLSIWLSGLRHDIPALRRLENLSTRGALNPGDDTMIVGFVTGGVGVKDVLIRGVGPGLKDFGVVSTLQDPHIEVFKDGQAMASNDDWSSGEVGAEIEGISARVGAFALKQGSRDAAVALAVQPGAYTAWIRDQVGQGGNALVEIYDLDDAYPVLSDLSNLSTRGSVGAGQNLIGGFVITGNSPKRVLIRGIGPTLAAYGVAEPLPSARLVLSHHVNGDLVTIGDNLGWSTHPRVDLIEETSARIGAFPLEIDSLDSALLLWLEPGVYTFTVQPGSPNLSGTALIEVYQVD